MLLKEQKLNGQSICYVDSSKILAFKYNFEKKELSVIFSDGSQYVYYEVPKYEYNRLKVSDSQGKYFNVNIRLKFKYEKAPDNIDVTEIIQVIQELKEDLENEVLILNEGQEKIIYDNPAHFLGLSHKERFDLSNLFIDLRNLLGEVLIEDKTKMVCNSFLHKVYLELGEKFDLHKFLHSLNKFVTEGIDLGGFVDSFVKKI